MKLLLLITQKSSTGLPTKFTEFLPPLCKEISVTDIVSKFLVKKLSLLCIILVIASITIRELHCDTFLNEIPIGLSGKLELSMRIPT
ncbi:hypothetical protein WA026_012343 [Henosepilachna vigintioctopunctata]|uniref:Uncharacterized protein n=1 Tax=Henosepilachna vigintioctopunctata TaxID=420089 RepID=A0AAW1UWT9_9CUCU